MLEASRAVTAVHRSPRKGYEPVTSALQNKQTAECWLVGANHDEVDALMAYVEHMADTFENDMYPGEVLHYIMRLISIEVMRDPVTTPNGASYVTQRFMCVDVNHWLCYLFIVRQIRTTLFKLTFALESSD